jgi:tetratricopeptide (TPR) repeat protein
MAVSKAAVRSVVAAACLVAAWCVPGTAVAQDSAEAERLFNEGLVAAENGDYQGAVRAFEASYDLNPVPEVLYNIAACRRELGDAPGAANALRDFAAGLGSSITPEQAADLETQLGELIPQIGRIALDVGERGATVRIDGVDVGTTPLGPWIALLPGRHQVEVLKDGFQSASMAVDAPPGETTTVAVALVAEGSTAPPGDGGISPWFWVTAGLTGASAIAMAVTGGITLKYKDEYLDGDHTDQGLYDDIVVLRTTTDVLLGVTLAGAAAATLIYFLAGGEESPPEADSGAGAALLPTGLAVWW